MNTTEAVIGEHDIVILRNPAEGWPAGTRGTVISMFPTHRWVEVADESNDWGYTTVSVPVEDLELVWKSPHPSRGIQLD